MITGQEVPSLMKRRRNGPEQNIADQVAVAASAGVVVLAAVAMHLPSPLVLCLPVQRDKSMTVTHSVYRMAVTEGCGEPTRLSWDKRG